MDSYAGRAAMMDAATARTSTTPPPKPHAGVNLPPQSILSELLQQHRAWLESSGEAGHQADLSGANLEGMDLTDADLRKALLNKTNLQGADLLLADLREASLLQANLQEANLLGTRLQEAGLQGAQCTGAKGLLSSQLAGANLSGAAPPESTSAFEGLRHVRAVSRRACWLLLSMVLLNALACLRIATASDTQLLQNASALPFSVLPRAVPIVAFHLFGPILLLALYVCFHLYLQRLWDAAGVLPAIFPDGGRLDASLPWFSTWCARDGFQWLRGKKTAISMLEYGISLLLLYWIVPATLLFFWGRYLVMQDLRGSLLHTLLIVAASAAALYFPRAAGKSFKAELTSAQGAEAAGNIRPARARISTLIGIGCVLALLSVGTILGEPHDAGPNPAQRSLDIRRWAAHVFWLAGYSPYAEISGSNISKRPSDWTGGEEELAGVTGARLDRLTGRYLQGYGAFLAKAHLWQADLSNAQLSEADLREANLRQAILRSAILDGAKLNRTMLQQADLAKANLTGADLREANASFASLAGAVFLEARLDGAILYKSDLHDAVFKRASLEKTDLRETNLQGSDLSLANLREAYLDSAKLTGAKLSQAQFVRAIMMDTDLRGADLSGATLQGAVLRGAALDGANLEGADLRGATGLNAGQLCAAGNLRQVQLDEGLARDLEERCSINH